MCQLKDLIQLVQARPVLYDASHQDYMKSKLKEEIWEKIAQELPNTSGKSAKGQWEKLRDCYRDALRRQKRKRDDHATVAIRPWIYQKQMAFLLPHMAQRITSSLCLDSINNSTDSLVDVIADEEVDVAEEIGNTNYDSCCDDVDECLENPPDDESTTGMSNGNRKEVKTSHSNEVLMNSLRNCDERAKLLRDDIRKATVKLKTIKAEPDRDPLRQFFTSMYLSTKDFPLTHQLRVKKRLFEAVSEAEEDLLHCHPLSESWKLQPFPEVSIEVITK